jgi:hypothetical protein
MSATIYIYIVLFLCFASMAAAEVSLAFVGGHTTTRTTAAAASWRFAKTFVDVTAGNNVQLLPKPTSTVLSAYVYGAEGNKEGISLDGVAWLTSPELTTNTNTNSISDSLNSQKASLARVVAALPPTGHSLDLHKPYATTSNNL